MTAWMNPLSVGTSEPTRATGPILANLRTSCSFIGAGTEARMWKRWGCTCSYNTAANITNQRAFPEIAHTLDVKKIRPALPFLNRSSWVLCVSWLKFFSHPMCVWVCACVCNSEWANPSPELSQKNCREKFRTESSVGPPEGSVSYRKLKGTVVTDSLANPYTICPFITWVLSGNEKTYPRVFG